MFYHLEDKPFESKSSANECFNSAVKSIKKNDGLYSEVESLLPELNLVSVILNGIIMPIPALSSPFHTAGNDIAENKQRSRKLSDSKSEVTAGLTEIHQIMPHGVELKKNAYGYGVFATEFFPKDSVVYISEAQVIPNKYAEYRLIIQGMQDSLLLDTVTHSVQFNETERYLYLFDSFMNHSCDPNTISRQTPEERSNNQYAQVAVRDIQPGDEISCDYNLFEYDCEDKSIEKCFCDASDCIGRVAGFKYLTEQQMKKRLDRVELEVLNAMSSDPTNKFIYIDDLRCPTNDVEIQSMGEEYKIVTKRAFKQGDVVYSNDSLLFPEGHRIAINFNCNGVGRMWVDNLVHTVNKGENIREFYYFDSFQNHSCDPNTYMVYHTDSAYDLVATRDIAAGEEVFSDYESFDPGYDGISFQCRCGSFNCRGTIDA